MDEDAPAVVRIVKMVNSPAGVVIHPAEFEAHGLVVARACAGGQAGPVGVAARESADYILDLARRIATERAGPAGPAGAGGAGAGSGREKGDLIGAHPDSPATDQDPPGPGFRMVIDDTTPLDLQAQTEIERTLYNPDLVNPPGQTDPHGNPLCSSCVHRVQMGNPPFFCAHHKTRDAHRGDGIEICSAMGEMGVVFSDGPEAASGWPANIMPGDVLACNGWQAGRRPKPGSWFGRQKEEGESL